MAISPHALFTSLLLDLSVHLPTYNLTGSDFRQRMRPEGCAREFACLSLLDSFLKKFQDEVEPEADERALRKFLDANAHCKGYTTDTSAMTEIQAVALGEFRSIMWDFFQPTLDHYWLDAHKAMASGKFGPGASVGVKGTSFYRKVGSAPLTTTKRSIYHLYQQVNAQSSLGEDAELTRERHYGAVEIVPGCVLGFVPKSREITRTKCTEPSLEMFFQQGIAKQITERLERYFGITLPLQESRNQCLAEIGSRTGKVGTIDLASASDTIAWSMLREFIPPYAMSILMEARSGHVVLPSGEIIPLHMVSSMGNAFTFPLQTAIFSSVVLGCYRALGIPVRKPVGAYVGNFGVYGDDIIVCREAYDLVSNLLGRLGFTVNSTKSYNEGPFRESCGADFWAGHNVRGIYCTTLKTIQDRYSLLNRLMTWSCNHGVDLTNVITTLIQESGMKFVPVPPWENDDAGVRVPWSMASGIVRKREEGTRAVVYLAYRSEPDSLDLNLLGSEQATSPGKERRRLGDLVKLRSSLKEKKLVVNTPAILLSALAGYLKGGKLVERQPAYYEKRACVAPCWEWHSPSLTGLSEAGWRRWLYGAEASLGSGFRLPYWSEVTQ